MFSNGFKNNQLDFLRSCLLPFKWQGSDTQVLGLLDTAEKRQNFLGFATMAHQKPDSFMEFEGYFKLGALALMKKWPTFSVFF